MQFSYVPAKNSADYLCLNVKVISNDSKDKVELINLGKQEQAGNLKGEENWIPEVSSMSEIGSTLWNYWKT